MCKLYYMIVNSAAKILLFFESCKRFWNFYRVWRKIFTEFGENRPKKSKYVNTSKNMFCSASRTLCVAVRR